MMEISVSGLTGLKTIRYVGQQVLSTQNVSLTLSCWFVSETGKVAGIIIGVVGGTVILLVLGFILARRWFERFAGTLSWILNEIFFFI